MLLREKIEPRKLGYDRPSPKFLNFLDKYYGLNDFIPQNNNFVVFKDYFTDVPKQKDKFDIYNNNNSYNNYHSNFNNNNYNNNYNMRNPISQRKLGKLNKEVINENNNQKIIENNEKEFATKIYNEYNSLNEKKEKQDDDINKYKENQKKSFGYNQYQSSSSEYGAFFHMNK